MINNVLWNGVRLRIQSYNVLVGDAQLQLKRCFRDSHGTPILMLPGFLETCEVFMPKNPQAGLAPFLASQGFDVYLLEIRGKGSSWPSAGRSSRWGLHEAICEDLPAHLGMIEKLRPGEPQFWLGHGLGSLILTGTYARVESLPSPLLGMIHVCAGRMCQLEGWQKTLRYQAWLWAMNLQRFFRGFVAVPFSQSTRRETRKAFATYKRWLQNPEWRDQEDDFDYALALRQKGLPASLYFANDQRHLWGNVQDCRRWLQELGVHDARLVTVSKRGGNDKNYSYNGVLRNPAACTDHFLQLQAWLQEHGPQTATAHNSELMEA